MTPAERPLSPFQLGSTYRPQLTSVLSFSHRATGVALSVGTVFLVWWLVAAATGDGAFATAQWFWARGSGMLMLLGWTFSLFFHLCNGIRHLVWDAGYGFELRTDLRLGLDGGGGERRADRHRVRRRPRGAGPAMSGAAAMRSPLGRAIGLGSAKEGVAALVGAAPHRGGAGAAGAVVRRSR